MFIFQALLVILVVWNLFYVFGYSLMLKVLKSNNPQYKELLRNSIEKYDEVLPEHIRYQTTTFVSKAIVHLFTLLLINVLSLAVAPAIFLWIGIYMIISVVRMVQGKIELEKLMNYKYKTDVRVNESTIKMAINGVCIVMAFFGCLAICIGLVILL